MSVIATFIDNTIDKTTATFLVKAKFPNPKGSLLPGEYVKMRLVVDQIQNGVVVPEQAVNETQAGTVVYILTEISGKTGKVAVQKVVAAQTYEGLRVITEGLEAGVPVVVEGLQLIRPGVSRSKPSRRFSRAGPSARLPAGAAQARDARKLRPELESKPWIPRVKGETPSTKRAESKSRPTPPASSE